MTPTMILASFVAVALPASGVTQTSPSIDYDSYMQLGEQRRIELFNAATPENRAELVRTHIERWLAANRQRLSAQQISVMEENSAFVTPDIYKSELKPETINRAKELERRTAAIFTVEDMRQALTIHGDYIPKR